MVRLRDGQSFPKKEEEEPTPPPPPSIGRRKRAPKRATNAAVVQGDVKPDKLLLPPAAGKQKRASKRSTSAGDQQDDNKLAKMPTPEKPKPNKSAAAAAGKRNVTVEDPDALNCGIFFLPLKPPIYQCEVGHVVCSTCRNKLKNQAKCHVCGGATGGFRRCHAMERLLESIHVACPNTTHGCTAKPAYYEQEGHQQTCVMLDRLRCPGKACGFVGSIDSLLAHFAGVHRWPCTTKVREARYQSCKLLLRNGFNFLRTNLPSATSTTLQFLFLINLAWQPDGAVISVLCIQSGSDMSQRPSLKSLKCDLRYSGHWWDSSHKSDLISHYQTSKFKVACTDFSQGLPNLNDRFHFLIPNFALEDGHTETVEISFNFKLE